MKKKIFVSLSILFIVAVSLIHADTIVITPCDDMYTDVEHPTLPPVTTELWVAEFEPAGHFERIMIKFDLEQLSGQTIESATINLNRFLGCPQGGTTSTNFYVITESWDEETWNPHTHAQYDSYVWAFYGFNVNGWHNIDITQLVQTWIDNGLENYGLLIKAQAGSKFSKFYSKEHSNSNLHPYLEVYYTPVNIDNNTIQETNLNLQNYPNPFNPSTTISFETTNLHENTRIEIYNLKGQKIRTFLIHQFTNIPVNQIVWDGKDENNNPVVSGIYFYNLDIDGKTIVSEKMILMK
ncbi:MAG: DNRLRE domain-containing protein [Candidatus Cloacimonadota bacterium]|nr:DNRLRE domain-containing protein [Candidatus Cloacimonadota bacterium]